MDLRASSGGATEPLLDIEDIQGNILAGFSKDHQLLIAVHIENAASARRWLRRIAGAVSTTAEVLDFNRLFKSMRARLGAEPSGLVATWVNLAVSHAGLVKLASLAEADGVPDTPFREGMPARAALLNDRTTIEGGDPTMAWVIGGSSSIPDVLLIVASDDPQRLHLVAQKVSPGERDGPGPPQVIWQELGETLHDMPGHEHFGFKDGVSQPGVRGRVAVNPDLLLTPRLLEPPFPGEVEFSQPGQPLVWPGQFVFGYPSTNPESGAAGGPLPPVELTPPWLKNGSLLVFRRLRQRVAEFRKFLQDTASALSLSAFPGMTPDRLGALLVGRWSSGAPISRARDTDDPEMAAASMAANDFLFARDTPPPRFIAGVQPPASFPAAVDDLVGQICPRAAHIRKINPRDHDSNLGDQFDTLRRRVIRRGIPYGPSLPPDAADDGVDRGLHFLCYQTSIEEQFEVLQSGWANSIFNPSPRGHDIIIGQPERGLREIELQTPAAAAHTITVPMEWVVTTGGGYFFAPSVSAIRDILSDPKRGR